VSNSCVAHCRPGLHDYWTRQVSNSCVAHCRPQVGECWYQVAAKARATVGDGCLWRVGLSCELQGRATVGDGCRDRLGDLGRSLVGPSLDETGVWHSADRTELESTWWFEPTGRHEVRTLAGSAEGRPGPAMPLLDPTGLELLRAPPKAARASITTGPDIQPIDLNLSRRDGSRQVGRFGSVAGWTFTW